MGLGKSILSKCAAYRWPDDRSRRLRGTDFPPRTQASAIPVFYLHIRSGGHVILDEDGLDLPDIEAARYEAIRGARGLMAAELETGILHLAQAIVIHDDTGHEIGCIEFREAVQIVMQSAGRALADIGAEKHSPAKPRLHTNSHGMQVIGSELPGLGDRVP